ncbi:LOW QUALITY PROTEIN: hypothetical protein U9M48_037287 [Paspalum notatum var. saurae]|uniref:CCHC-type domain-containing protein n=1 Tax=Paspalum notatum var. saurae TaxID=547442 RepID=A0AAQ3UJD1_PASNO
MLRLFNPLPQRTGECRRHRLTDTATSIPTCCDTQSPWCAAAPSPGSVLFTGIGLEVDAKAVLVEATATIDDDLEEGEIPAAGEFGGESASSSARDSLPLRGPGPSSSSPAAGDLKAREANRASPTRSTCSTPGRSERDAAQKVGEEDADPDIGGLSKEGCVEIASCNVQTDLGEDEWCVEADPTIIIQREVEADEILNEDFWHHVGLPEDARWWPHEKETAARGAASVPEVCSNLSVPSSSTSREVPFSQKSCSRPRGRSFKRLGWMMRPWKGLLPRPKTKTVVMLTDFMPAMTTSIAVSESTTQMDDPSSGRVISDVQNFNILESFASTERDHISRMVGPTVHLIRRARDFGRSRQDLFSQRKVFWWTPRVLNQPARACPSVPLPAVNDLAPTTSTIHIKSVHQTKKPPLHRPKYAAMAARPPALHRFRGSSAGRDREDRDRNQFRGPPRREEPAHPRFERPGNGGGRGNHGPAGHAERRRTDHREQYQQPRFPPPRFAPRDPTEGNGERPRDTDHRVAVDELNGQGSDKVMQNQVVNQARASKKVKKPRPPHCFKCKTNGHTVDKCTAVLYCAICNKKDNHPSTRCPILKLPKPDASMFGFGGKELGFFRISDSGINLEASECTSTGLVKVTGGSLTAEVLQQELARLNRADWNWEAIPHGSDSFLVAFPSVDELKRMIDIAYFLKNHKVTITVSEWRTDGIVEPIYHLDDAWIHVTGVPHNWRHYLVFWALGSVIGYIEEVDMLTYRQKGIIRSGNNEQGSTSNHCCVVFGREGYNITFSLEPENFEPGSDIPASENQFDKDDNGNGEEDRMEEDEDQVSKKLKGTVNANPPSSGQVEEGAVPMQTACRNNSASSPLPLAVIVTKPPPGAEDFCASLTRQSLHKYGYLSDSSLSQAVQQPQVAMSASGTLSSSNDPQLAGSDMAMANSDGKDIAVEKLDLGKNCSITPCENSSIVSKSTDAGHQGLNQDVEMLQNGNVPSTDSSPSPDENMMVKAMRRTAEKNLNGNLQNKSGFEVAAPSQPIMMPSLMLPGYLCSRPLDAFVGYPPESRFTGHGYGGFATVGTSGYGYLLPGTWVASSYNGQA